MLNNRPKDDPNRWNFGEMQEYGVLYARVCFPKDHRLNWLSYCNLFNLLPKDLKDEVIRLADHINQKYKEQKSQTTKFWHHLR